MHTVGPNDEAGRPGVLYVVATPIGNLGDMTVRALEVLRACDRVVAEDTRRTRGLLSHFGIAGKPLDGVEAHASDGRVARVVEHLVQGEQVALVTDAGMPSISDPGGALVRAAVEQGIRVVPVPGASSLTAAIAVSGIVEGPFRFYGFIARSGSARRNILHEIAHSGEAVVLFEAPSRLTETLRELAYATPNRAAVVAREMTKLHEEFVRGTLSELAADAREWMGEITLVLGAVDRATEATVDDDAVDARIDQELLSGGHARTVADRIAAWSGRGRREVYARVLDRKRHAARSDG